MEIILRTCFHACHSQYSESHLPPLLLRSDPSAFEQLPEVLLLFRNRGRYCETSRARREAIKEAKLFYCSPCDKSYERDNKLQYHFLCHDLVMSGQKYDSAARAALVGKMETSDLLLMRGDFCERLEPQADSGLALGG